MNTSLARLHKVGGPGVQVLAAVVLAVTAVVLILLLRHAGWDVTRFILAGSRFTDASHLTAPIAVLPNRTGYDGQFYYRLALDPFTSHVTQYGVTLDNPALRGQRILFPLLAWALSLGRAGWVPWAMVEINVASLYALARAATRLAERYGLPAYFGLIVPLYPGFVVTLARDTTELLASALAFVALLAAVERRFGRAAILATLAMLTRETTLLYLAGFGVVEVFAAIRARRWSWNIAILATPLAAYLVWHAVIGAVWGGSPFAAQDIDLIPLDGLIRFVVSLPGHHSPAISSDLVVYFLAAVVFCIYACVLTLIAFRSASPWVGLKISWLLYFGLALTFSTAIWVEPWAYLRVLCDLYLIGGTFLLLARRRWLATLLAAGAAPVWLMTLHFLLR